MITIEDLTGIEAGKRREAVDCLDYLLAVRDADGRPAPIITGYNWYNKLPESDTTVSLSHHHQTEEYKQAMVSDLVKLLNYQREAVLGGIRCRGTNHLWDLEYNTRDDNGNILTGSRIKDRRNGQYIDIEKYRESLDSYAEFKDAQGQLVNELGSGWELNMPFTMEEELMRLTGMFLRKSYKENVDHWFGAYKSPVIILGEEAMKYREKLQDFIPATKIALLEGHNEISFVIHENLDRLKSVEQFERLKSLGFRHQMCLANKSFVEEIDKFK